jgi:probable selenium-dependent hydroxylase accessory protein YqeC
MKPELSRAEALDSLLKILAPDRPALLSLVGAGGKTSLMFTLAGVLRDRGLRVLSTTSTKIFIPGPEDSPEVILGGPSAFDKIEKGLAARGHITWAAEALPGNKLKGPSLEEISAFWSRGSAEVLLVEADGSSQKPVKAPGEHEPVIPPETTGFITVIGLSALGKPLTGDWAFRPERISALTGVPLSHPLTVPVLAELLTHPEGGLKGSRPSMKVLAFLNQLDLAPSIEEALTLARTVREKGRAAITRVLVGQIKNPSQGSARSSRPFYLF